MTPTPKQLATLSPEEVRVMCAETAGWVRTPLPEPFPGGGDTYCYWTSPTGERGDDGFDPWNARCTVPRYDESADAALQLVAWMAKDGWVPQITLVHGVWQCAAMWTSGKMIVEEADTAPMAVCRAFLVSRGSLNEHRKPCAKPARPEAQT